MTLGELNTCALRAQEQGYTFFLSFFPPVGARCCRITLERQWPDKEAEVKVVGYGSTPSEAFEDALSKFPSLTSAAATDAEDVKLLFGGMEDHNGQGLS